MPSDAVDARRRCHVCGSDDLAAAYIVRGHRIVRCRACRLLFVADSPPPERLAALYDDSFFRTGRKFSDELPAAGAERNAALRLRWIGREPGTLLDVGCATGDFLLHARSRGWTVAGVEWSPYAAGIARRRGLDVQAASFVDADFGGRRFDVVTAWDYVEHVPDPLRHLERARELLSPGGLLLLSTGDAASLSARLSGRWWHLMIPPKHLYFFDRSNLRLLLERAGFVVRWMRWPGKYVNLGFLATKGAALFPSAPTRALARLVERSGLGGRDLYVNLRDIVTVAAAPAARRPSA